jgi:HEPN domain-containing protein
MPNNLFPISATNNHVKTSLPPKSLSHEARIKQITDIIVATAKDKIASIILFGPFANGDWIFGDYNLNSALGLVLDQESIENSNAILKPANYKIASNYHLLIITKTKQHSVNNSAVRLEKRITDEINKNIKDKTHPIHLMIEPIDYFNCSNNQKKYFFADIKKDGILLYDSKEFELLPLIQLDSQERIMAAKINYRRLMDKVERFKRYFHVGMNDGDLKGAAFNLHQMVEFLFNCVLLVFNGYEARTHDLKRLNKLCAANSNNFLTIFPTILPEEKRSFFLLQKAYLQSRYGKEYEINRDQLQYLSSRAEILMEVVIKDCGKLVAVNY